MVDDVSLVLLSKAADTYWSILKDRKPRVSSGEGLLSYLQVRRTDYLVKADLFHKVSRIRTGLHGARSAIAMIGETFRGK
jgi:hypothetical protein